MNLTKTEWPGGWTPSEDPVNGSPQGLIRADNLQQDEDGVLSLIRGMQQVGSGAFPDYVSDVYSKFFGAQEALYVGLNVNGHTVIRSLDGQFDDQQTIIASGTNRAVFGDALGRVLVCAGSARVKDDGSTNGVQALGLQTAGTPTIVSISQPVLAFYQRDPPYGVATNRATGTGQLILGSQFTGDTYGYSGLVDPDTLQFVYAYELGATTDTTNIDTGPATDIGFDTIQFVVQPDDPASMVSIRVDFVLDTDLSHLTTLFNYYSYTWGADELLAGTDTQTPLSAYRKDFTRFGSDAKLDWRHVTAIIYTATALSNQFVAMQGMSIYGGATGQLSGTYRYLQVNINNTGQYLAKSPASDPTDPIFVSNGNVKIQTGTTDNQTTECWIFRISSVVPPAGTGSPQQTTFLNQYYRVGVCTPGATITDDLSDNDAIQIDIVANLFLNSLQQTDVNGVKDDIIGMEGLYNEYMIYMTTRYLYVSDALNPDAVDIRYTLKAFGDPTEKNLWVKKLTNNVLILGTTKNLYEISGSLRPLPDGTVDANIIPIGEAYPPLSNDCCIVNGGIFYPASDGIRVTTGSNSTLVSPQLRLLFQGSNRAGVPPVAIIPNNNARYSLAVGKTKLYCTLPMQDGTRRLLVYDLIKQNWFLRYTDPEIVFVTLSDRVLVGYNVSTNPNTGLGKLFQIDVGQGLTSNSGSFLQGFPCTFLTVYDANGQPRNRKDTFTLKIVANTGGSNLNVGIAFDGGSFTQLGTISSTVQTTFYFPLNNVTLGFRYALQISDVGYVSFLKIYEVTIEYEARPEQLDYLRIIPTNMGSYARKRWTSFAYVIDTLGNNITFQPYVDNTATGNPDVFSTVTKLTHITFFQAETIGTDVGGIFSGGVFEFYGPNLEETVSEKLPTPCEFLIIPANDYGTPNRKRHTSYKFQILTRGGRVQFTPLLDNTTYSSRIYNTTKKTTVEYFFDTALGDVIGIDVGGTLQSLDGIPFEFYGVVIPQTIEKLPDRLEFFRIPNTNYGAAARKRLRTIPIVIDTYGSPVTFTPIVDGVLQSNSTVLVSTGKTTLYHYFITDTFGTDFGGQLQSTASPSPTPFEFYELGQPEDVEVLPVPKRYDQLGPVRFDKIGKLFAIRIRLIMNGSTVAVPYQIYGDTQVSNPTYDSNPLFSGSFGVVPQVDQVYEINLPKSVNSNLFRLVLGPTTDSFHRYDVQVRVSQSGMESDSRWIPIR